MDLEFITKFQNQLLDWYDKNARILPWRDNPSPYRVWISEIMLQQTRVDTVKPYFENFIHTVPTIEALAAIPEDRLLKLWEGLGYYSRARNLKKAAGVLVEEFHSRLPSDIEELKTLPGIGPYTAGAIASIAFGKKAHAIDGNVLRVMSRIFANKEDVANSKVKKEIGERVFKLLPDGRVGDFNQALMELGATVCMPSGPPKCMECPVHGMCEGFLQGIAVELPVKAKKKERKVEQRTVFVLEFNECIAIRQRPSEGLLSSLWEFPNVEGHLALEECEEQLRAWGMEVNRIEALKSSKHIFSHLEWHMIGYYVSVPSLQEDSPFQWATVDRIREEYSIPTAFKAYTNLLTQGW